MASLRRMESVLLMRLRECTERLSCLKSRFLCTVRRLCAMHIFALQNNMETIGIQMTYCNLETEQTKYFREEFSFEEIKKC